MSTNTLFPAILLTIALAVSAGSEGDAWAASVCLDPGHGGSDPGALGIYCTEAFANLEVGLDAVYYIDRIGYQTIGMTRTGDYYVSLADRVAYANENGFDRFMSVHHNAFDTTVQGTETYCHPGGSGDSYDLRDCVQPWIIWAFGYRDRGTKTADFYVLRNTNMPAILGEGSFIDYRDGYDESYRFLYDIDDHSGREGYAYCAGYCDHYGYYRPPYEGAGSVIVMDTDRAGYRGEWHLGTMAPDKYGENYLWSSTEPDGKRAAWWIPNIPQSGNWKVYAWWSQGGNRCNRAPLVVRVNAANHVTRVNQQVNGGQWNLLGTYYFPAGRRGGIGVVNHAAAGSVVIADAVRFELTGDDHLPVFPELARLTPDIDP